MKVKEKTNSQAFCYVTCVARRGVLNLWIAWPSRWRRHVSATHRETGMQSQSVKP